jgi:hypothetical protein
VQAGTADAKKASTKTLVRDLAAAAQLVAPKKM